MPHFSGIFRSCLEATEAENNDALIDGRFYHFNFPMLIAHFNHLSDLRWVKYFPVTKSHSFQGH